jgi:hypothetical protein
VEVLFERQGAIYLDQGFDKFSHEHDLEVGYLLHFFYKDDGERSIKVFDDSSYRKYYHGNDSCDDNGNNNGQL